MNKVGDMFTKTFEVEKKKLYFKFIVDGEWLYSNEYSQAPDSNGNLNNFIDLRDPDALIDDVDVYEEISESAEENDNFN